jgi:hypothetical protein
MCFACPDRPSHPDGWLLILSDRNAAIIASRAEYFHPMTRAAEFYYAVLYFGLEERRRRHFARTAAPQSRRWTVFRNGARS